MGSGRVFVAMSGGVDSGLLRAIDRAKDQSYVLYSLGQEELKHLLFPWVITGRMVFYQGEEALGGGIIEGASSHSID